MLCFGYLHLFVHSLSVICFIFLVFCSSHVLLSFVIVLVMFQYVLSLPLFLFGYSFVLPPFFA